MSKLIVVFGGTGKQGGSVINAFLKDPTWKIRTITRNVAKPQSIALQEKGVEVVQGDLNDVDSLTAAVQGANVVFGVTDFWEPFFNPATQEKLAPGQLVNQYCYNKELQQGKNIADAVATIADTTLDLFVWSNLAHVNKWSNGKYTWVYHFDSKAEIYAYIKESLPNLAKKTSSVQIGYYADNWLTTPHTAPQKAEDGVYEWKLSTKAETLFPWVVTQADTGKFVRALVQMSPGKDMLGASEMVTYGDYLKAWGDLNGVPTRFTSISAEEYEKGMPEVIAKEIQEGVAFNEEFGWDGGEPGVLHPS
ncbi:putative hscarg dehydrogenase, partial [Umbelopsis sp. AD052]